MPPRKKYLTSVPDSGLIVNTSLLVKSPEFKKLVNKLIGSKTYADITKVQKQPTEGHNQTASPK